MLKKKKNSIYSKIKRMVRNIIDKSLMQFFCCPTESIVYLTFELLFNVKKEKEKRLYWPADGAITLPLTVRSTFTSKSIEVKSLCNMHIWGLFYSQEDSWHSRHTYLTIH